MDDRMQGGAAALWQGDGALRSWLAVLSLAAGTFVMVTTEFLPIGLLTEIAAGLQVSAGTAGLMITVPGIVAAFAAPLLILAAGGLDRRHVLWGLSGLLIVANTIAALAPSLPMLLLGRVLLGVSVGGFWALAASVGRRLVPEASAGRATAVILTGISVGTVCGVPAGALIGDLAGWRMAFAITGAVAVLVLLAQIALLPPLPAKAALGLRQLLSPLAVPMARIGHIVAVLIAAGHFAAYTYLEPFLQQAAGLEPGAIAALLVAYGVAGIFGTFIGEAAMARGLRGGLIATALTLAAAMLLAATLGYGPVAAAVLVTVWGLAFGAVPIGVTTWMFKAVPDNAEAGQALLVCTFQIALALGALVGGLVVDGAGVSSAMLVGGILALTAAVVIGAAVRSAPIRP